MTALAVNRVIGRFGEDENVSNPIVSYGVGATFKLYGGAQVALNAAGYLQPAGTAGALKVIGISRKLVDNSFAGAVNGGLVAEVEVGVFPMNFPGSGADTLTIANLYEPVFAIDDNNVGATDGNATRVYAGILVGFDGAGKALVQYAPTEPIAVYAPYTFQKTAADGAAATATSEFPFFVAPFAGKVLHLAVANGASTLTASDTNYATVIVSKRTAGGAAVAVAQFTTQTTGQPQGTGSWAAWSNLFAPAAGILANFAQGDQITFQITKTGTGVVVPISTFEVDIIPI